MPEVTSADPARSDGHALANELYDRMRGDGPDLAGMPPNIKEAKAKEIANFIGALYTQEVKRGVQPGVARAQALTQYYAHVNLIRKQNGLAPIADPAQAPAGQPGADPNILPGQNPGAVTGEDVKAGTDVYRDAIKSGKDVYGRILARTGVPDPSAVDFFNKNRVQPTNVAASTVTPLSTPLEGVLAEGTTVENTDLADLQATARGEGAGQQAARARMDQLLFRQGQQASGQVQGARGYERRGLRRALLGQQAEQTIAAGKAMAEVDATTSLQAQQQVANFDARKKELQANLDAARRSGDAGRIQQAQKDMADFEQETKKFNAQQTQGAATTNAANAQAAQGTNLTQGLAAIGQDFETWKQSNELALSAQKALEDSARGLLNEDQRQQMLTMARRQLANAEKEYEENKARADRQEQARNASQRMQFWGTVITSLVAYGVTAATGNPAAGAAAGSAAGAATQAAGAAHGGVVDRATQLLVGEAGEHEIVIPLKGRVSDRLLAALSVDSKPFQASGPSGQIDNMAELTKAIRATLNTAPSTDDDMTSMLASATIRARRAR